MKRTLILLLALCLLFGLLCGCTPDKPENERPEPSLPGVNAGQDPAQEGRTPAGETEPYDPNVPEDTGLPLDWNPEPTGERTKPEAGPENGAGSENGTGSRPGPDGTGTADKTPPEPADPTQPSAPPSSSGPEQPDPEDPEPTRPGPDEPEPTPPETTRPGSDAPILPPDIFH